ncbi:hypothetical protein ABIB94_008670 [Bradyrhizobium sp. JR7.2]
MIQWPDFIYDSALDVSRDSGELRAQNPMSPYKPPIHMMLLSFNDRAFVLGLRYLTSTFELQMRVKWGAAGVGRSQPPGFAMPPGGSKKYLEICGITRATVRPEVKAHGGEIEMAPTPPCHSPALPQQLFRHPRRILSRKEGD